MLLSRLRGAGETPQAAGSRLVGKVHESAATTGNLTSPHAPELKFPVIAATNKGLSRFWDTERQTGGAGVLLLLDSSGLLSVVCSTSSSYY